MRILFLGDIVGRSGRKAVIARMDELRARLKPDMVVVNCENAAGGFGITRKIADELFACGIDVLTSGNHVYDQREAKDFMADEPRLLRPINYVEDAPGFGTGIYETKKAQRLAVINVMGIVFMEKLDDPFKTMGEVMNGHVLGKHADAILVDFHGEATAEKMTFGWFVDGKVSAVVGTHTHVPTADCQILPGGTGFMSDAGMCGDYVSVIGMKTDEPLRRMVEGKQGGRFAPADGEATLSGLFLETDDQTGLTKRLSPVRTGGSLQEQWPDF